MKYNLRLLGVTVWKVLICSPQILLFLSAVTRNKYLKLYSKGERGDNKKATINPEGHG